MASQDQAKSYTGGGGATPLAGDQMAALQKQMTDKMAGIVKDVDLRKWSVDQACGLAGAAVEASSEPVDVVKLARAIHSFLTEVTSQTT
jgi:hypothetical protein